MASLMETLIDTLDRENKSYEQLIELSTKKAPVIIKGDLEGLNSITEKEQIIVGEIQRLEKIRMQTMKDIASVTNRGQEELKLQDLIKMMATRPKERDALTRLHDQLKTTLDAMKKINEHNQDLIRNALEMVEFEMNMVQSMRRAPETADYNKGAYSVGNIMGSGTKRFDSKS